MCRFLGLKCYHQEEQPSTPIGANFFWLVVGCVVLYQARRDRYISPLAHPKRWWVENSVLLPIQAFWISSYSFWTGECACCVLSLCQPSFERIHRYICTSVPRWHCGILQATQKPHRTRLNDITEAPRIQVVHQVVQKCVWCCKDQFSWLYNQLDWNRHGTLKGWLCGYLASSTYL